jgi:hypothetical protein
MLNGKYVSLETIVERVYRDTGFTLEVDWTDVAEWVGSVIDLINAPMQYIDRITDGNDRPHIEIVDGRGELPCDLVRIIQTRTCEGLPMRYSTDSFHFGRHVDGCRDMTCSADLTYKLSDDHIYTNFRTGKVEMAYLAFPTDERGYPMVPDDEVFKQAATAYVAERIGMRLLLRGQIQGGAYQLLKQERDWYVGKAQTKPLVPNRDKTRSIANQFRRLVSFEDDHTGGYRSTSEMQVIKNHSRYRR